MLDPIENAKYVAHFKNQEAEKTKKEAEKHRKLIKAENEVLECEKSTYNSFQKYEVCNSLNVTVYKN